MPTLPAIKRSPAVRHEHFFSAPAAVANSHSSSAHHPRPPRQLQFARDCISSMLQPCFRSPSRCFLCLAVPSLLLMLVMATCPACRPVQSKMRPPHVAWSAEGQLLLNGSTCVTVQSLKGGLGSALYHLAHILVSLRRDHGVTIVYYDSSTSPYQCTDSWSNLWPWHKNATAWTALLQLPAGALLQPASAFSYAHRCPLMQTEDIIRVAKQAKREDVAATTQLPYLRTTFECGLDPQQQLRRRRYLTDFYSQHLCPQLDELWHLSPAVVESIQQRLAPMHADVLVERLERHVKETAAAASEEHGLQHVAAAHRRMAVGKHAGTPKIIADVNGSSSSSSSSNIFPRKKTVGIASPALVAANSRSYTPAIAASSTSNTTNRSGRSFPPGRVIALHARGGDKLWGPWREVDSAYAEAAGNPSAGIAALLATHPEAADGTSRCIIVGDDPAQAAALTRAARAQLRCATVADALPRGAKAHEQAEFNAQPAAARCAGTHAFLSDVHVLAAADFAIGNMYSYVDFLAYSLGACLHGHDAATYFDGVLGCSMENLYAFPLENGTIWTLPSLPSERTVRFATEAADAARVAQATAEQAIEAQKVHEDAAQKGLEAVADLSKIATSLAVGSSKKLP